MRRYRLIMSRTCHRHLSRVLERAVDPRRGYPLPDVPRLQVGRLESLLDVFGTAEELQRARRVSASVRELGTLHALLGWALRGDDVELPPSARSLHRRAGWVIGLD